MTKLFASLLICLSFSGLAQLKMINPVTFPFTANNKYVFDDGTAYVIERGFFIKVSNIEDPANGNIEILKGAPYSRNNWPAPLFCFNKQHCICGTFRTTNGGRTWVNDFKLQQYTPQWCNEDGLCIKLGGSNGLWISDNYGKKWKGDLNYYQCRIVGEGINEVLIVDNWRDTLYAVSIVDSIYPLGRSSSFHPIGHLNYLAPIKNGFVSITSGTVVSQYDSLTQSITSIHNFPSLESMGKRPVVLKDADTIIIAGLKEVVYSYTNGTSWQVDSIEGDIKETDKWGNVIYDLQLKSFLHNGKVFIPRPNMNLDAGVFAFLDMDSLKYKYTKGNDLYSDGNLIELGNTFYMGSANNGKGMDAIVQVDTSGSLINRFYFPEAVEAYDFADSLNGFGLMGQNWNSLRYSTSDGGHTWSIDTLNYSDFDYSSRYVEDGNCIISRGRVQYRFNLFDKSFNLLNQNSNLPPINTQNSYFKNCDTGVVATIDQLYYTTDGGITFAPVLPNPNHDQIWGFTAGFSSYCLAKGAALYMSSNLDGPYQKFAFSSMPTLGTVTKDLKIMGHNHFNRMFYYSSDTGKTWQSAEIYLGKIKQIKYVGTNKYLLAGELGQLYILRSDENLNIEPGLNSDENPYDLNTIHFFPNPAKAEVNLEFPERGLREIKIINASGQVVLVESTHGMTHAIDISSFRGGMYFLQVKSGNEIQRLRLLKLD